jgi:hypothetical protein
MQLVAVKAPTAWRQRRLVVQQYRECRHWRRPGSASHRQCVASGSKIKIVDPNSYAPSLKPNGIPLYDKNTVYLNPQGQQVIFNPATNTWVRM